jgi:citronellol/citronellal dehydrogenase
VSSAPGPTAGRPLAGRVALVTGASRGIGTAIAFRFAQAGAAVAVTARTRAEGDHPLPGSLAETVSLIEGAGGRVLAVPADLSDRDDRERLVGEVRAGLGPIDVLVNNAAVTYFTPIAAFDARRFALMFEVQVTAPVHLAQLVLGDMRSSGRGGSILNISSPAARHPVGPPYGPGGGGTVYGMCKAAIERFSTGLAAEVWADGISVNALSPTGLVVTPGVVHHRLDQMIPVERHEPVELMAEAAFLLCSGDPRELTGRVTYSQELLQELGRR